MPAVSVTAEPTFNAAAPALEVTLERPSDALDEASDAFSFAASVVDEALRTPARRTVNLDCRSTARDAAADIVTGYEGELAMGEMGLAAWSWGVGELRDAERFSDTRAGLCVGKSPI